MLVVTISISGDWSLHHLYVNYVFLSGPLEKIVYVTHPHGFCNKKKGKIGIQVTQGLICLEERLKRLQ